MTSKSRSRDGSCSQDCPLNGFEAIYEQQRPSQLTWLGNSNLPSQQDQVQRLYSSISPWQTRLIRLHPGLLGTELVADLFVVDLILADGVVDHALQQRHTYEALSYCWGEPTFDSLITINGLKYPITMNLFFGLQRLRRSKRPRCLWIDALCINQHNANERSIQVQNMFDVYRKAEKVLVWLGECGDVTRFCLRYFASLRNGDVQNSNTFVRNCCVAHGRHMFQGLRKLFDKPWYRRLWIRQEVFAARDITVFCGETNLPWSWLTWSSRLASLLGENFEPTVPLRGRLETMFRGLAQASSSVLAMREYPELVGSFEVPGDDLFSFIQASVHCQCSDNRDRIYAILGMTVDHSRQRLDINERRHSLDVDYNRSTADVFQDAARYLMLSDNYCSLLCLKGTFGGMIDGEELPTWCPDWSLPQDLAGYRRNMYPGVAHQREHFYFEGGALHVKGIQVGTIVFLFTDTVVNEYGDRVFAEVLLMNGRFSRPHEVIGDVWTEDIVVSTISSLNPLILRRSDTEQLSYVGWLGEREPQIIKQLESPPRWFQIV